MRSFGPRETDFDKILESIEASAGRQFDPALVREIIGKIRSDPPKFAKI
jgi:response regulator RpfG family c-di-GMP phosphodiesterase